MPDPPRRAVRTDTVPAESSELEALGPGPLQQPVNVFNHWFLKQCCRGTLFKYIYLFVFGACCVFDGLFIHTPCPAIAMYQAPTPHPMCAASMIGSTLALDDVTMILILLLLMQLLPNRFQWGLRLNIA